MFKPAITALVVEMAENMCGCVCVCVSPSHLTITFLLRNTQATVRACSKCNHANKKQVVEQGVTITFLQGDALEAETEKYDNQLYSSDRSDGCNIKRCHTVL